MPKESAPESLAAAAGQTVSIRRSWVRPGRAPRYRTPLMILGIGILGYVIWMSSSKPPRANDRGAQNPLTALFDKKSSEPAAKSEKVPVATPSPAPNPVPVELTPPKSRPVVGPTGQRIERSAGTTVQWADKTDPSRLAGEFGYDSLEPLESKRYLVQSPHAWMFMKDGWSIYIKGDTGRMYIPDEQAAKRPESGTLRGNVVIKAFKPRPDRKRPDPVSDEAYLIAQTDSLAFDGSIGEISTVDRLTAKWPQGYFAGKGLIAVYNELRSRLESAEITEGEELLLYPETKESSVAKSPTPQPSSPSAPATPPVKSPAVGETAVVAAVPEQTFYRAEFASDVRITHEKRTLTSDQLELWAKLIDGKFVADAAPARKPREKSVASKALDGPAPVASTGNVTTPVAAASVEVAKPLEDAAPAPIRVTWSGPFTVRTADAPFAELEHDSLAMRFTSAKSGKVSAVDAAIGADAQSATMSYFATRRQIYLAGPGAEGVVVKSSDSGTVKSSNLSADLANGEATITGGGILESKSSLASLQSDAPVKASPTIHWTQQAQFVFDQSAPGGKIKEAMFAGDVVATDGASTLKGSFVRGEFVAVANQSSVLSRLTVQDQATVSDGAGGQIAADHLYATFVPLAREKGKNLTSVIETLQARGNVFAIHAQDQIHAGSLDTKFIVESSKPGQIATIIARDDVRIESEKLRASGAELKADFATQLVDLHGSETKYASATQDATTIAGKTLKLDGVGRTIEVVGQGTLSHSEKAKTQGVAASQISVSWKSSLAFDDRLGTAVVRGDVVANWLADAASLDILKSQSLDLAFTPFTEPVKSESKVPVASPTRELLKAIALGGDGTSASLESRRFDPSDTAPVDIRKPQRVTYLEGARIIADNVLGTLDVPGEGKLLVSDRRAAAIGAASEGSRSGSFAGDALFHWTQSLNVRREAGIADMVGNVEVVHLRPGDADATELRCEQITASMRVPQSSSAQNSQDLAKKNEMGMQGEITRILATGKVWARSATKREVNSDIMDYDALAGLVFLTARDGEDVQAFDPASGTPIRGKSLEWDLKLDRIRVRDVGGITVPR